METETRIAFDYWRKNLPATHLVWQAFPHGLNESIYWVFKDGYAAALATKPTFSNPKPCGCEAAGYLKHHEHCPEAFRLRQEFEAWFQGSKLSERDCGAWQGYNAAAKPRDARLLELEAELEQVRAACAAKHAVLKAMHDHASESCKVYFEEDILSKPIGEATDLGEAYQESDMCEKTEAALADQAAAPWLLELQRLRAACAAKHNALEMVKEYFDKHGTGKIFHLGYNMDKVKEKMVEAALALPKGTA